MVPQVKNPDNILSHKNLKNELGKFFSAAKDFSSRTGKPAFMPSCMVDQKWHSLIAQQDQKEYADLAQNNFGKIPEHVSESGFGFIAWVKDYEKKFGKLDLSWFYDTDGSFNQELFESYQRTGVLKCAWDCTPL